MTNQMKAIVAKGYGTPDVFELKMVEKPEPNSKEILVRVMTSSATRADSMIRTGKPYFGRLFLGFFKPKKPIPGTGFSGIVESVGTDVTVFKAGDRVFGETKFGFSSNAEYLTISEESVVLQMPENMDYSEAASFADGHLTSFNFLKEIGKVQPGQKVLINGASGALGTAGVQIAKHLGANVTAVCSEKNIGLVKSLGADEVIDYTKVDFTQGNQRYDLIYDTIGKSSFKACAPVLNENGQYLSPVLNGNLICDMIRTSLFGSRKAKFEATGSNSDLRLNALLKEVIDIYREGQLKTVIDRQFPLEKLAEAHRYIDGGHKRGNIVIINA
ncbi:MAG TPA: NAD(P)-dependent alcohol dehydrogenase [Flavobacteriales bacterium]|jgi:NADPH:quinone reductase-like Zn-dependent oxidoreductase|nr:NAD(P)-dependent alcohol dehydrogenase [Flavobacteriales bacterium]